MVRKGKIARLPREIRDELNGRLAESEDGGSLLRWLNELPAAKEILAREFGGAAVTKQNLYEWRSGGFVEWQARQEMLEQTRELAADARELTVASEGKLTDHLATVLAARYAVALAEWNGEVGENFLRKLRVLRGLCQDIVELRRGDHSGTRLQMEQERLGREQEKTEAEVVAHFEQWLKNPAVRDLVCQNWLPPEERQRRMRAIFGLEPEPPPAPEATKTEKELSHDFGLPPKPTVISQTGKTR